MSAGWLSVAAVLAAVLGLAGVAVGCWAGVPVLAVAAMLAVAALAVAETEEA